MQQIVQILRRQQQKQKEQDARQSDPAITILQAAIKDKNQDLCQLRANFSLMKEQTLRNMARAITPMRKRRKLRQGVERKHAKVLQHTQNASRRRNADDPHMQRLRSEKQTLFELWRDAEIRLHSKCDLSLKSVVNEKDASAKRKAAASSFDPTSFPANPMPPSVVEVVPENPSTPVSSTALKGAVAELRKKETGFTKVITEKDDIIQRFMRNPPDAWLKWIFKEKKALWMHGSDKRKSTTPERGDLLVTFKEEAELLDYMENYIDKADTTLERENHTLKRRVADLEELVNSLKAALAKQEHKTSKLQKTLLKSRNEDFFGAAKGDEPPDGDDSRSVSAPRYTRDKW